MTMIYFTCNVTALEELQELLNRSEISNFQVFPETLFSSSTEEPRMNSSVWPGHNASVLAQENDNAKVSQLRDLLNHYNADLPHHTEDISAYIWEVEKIGA